MRITHRICDVRRHTLGFVIDGKICTRSMAVKFARQGKLNEVHVVGKHIQTTPRRKQKLLNLPEKVCRN